MEISEHYMRASSRRQTSRLQNIFDQYDLSEHLKENPMLKILLLKLVLHDLRYLDLILLVL